ncbi:hypothetical protein DERP_006285 [Dermatophagoides pteronyssinus]|uniref:Secreted protein n=1 Tax=Dermatophagoides pteronyssinus TaxID=6956 RepID=A0ABQ8IY05_DERPT|nr:hypothetical protein DERP_006285 [Dermatophagoides pteronyssinus]
MIIVVTMFLFSLVLSVFLHLSHKSFIECHERCYDNAAEEVKGFSIMKFSCLSFNQLFRFQKFYELVKSTFTIQTYN